MVNKMTYDPRTRALVSAESATTGRVDNLTERFPDGALSVEQWTMGGDRVRLSFYPSAHLKSEERYSGENLTFARYYDESGTIEHSVGELPRRPW